jgi:hypothetical protein
MGMVYEDKWHIWWGEDADGKQEGMRKIGKCGGEGKTTLNDS